MKLWQDILERETTQESDVALIDHLGVLAVEGPDAIKFLQGQCTADLRSLSVGEAALGAFCNIQGRAIANFVALCTNNGFLLRMTASLTHVTVNALSKYAAFFKVDLKVWQQPSVIAQTQASSLGGELASMPGVFPMQFRVGNQVFDELLVSEDAIPAVVGTLREQNVGAEQQWLNRVMRTGMVTLDLQTSEKFSPHQLNFDRIDGVSFTKGCYTGQEIVARMEYRGKVKKRVQLIKLDLAGKATMLPQDLFPLDSQRTLGSLIQYSAESSSGLALLPIDLPQQGRLIIDGAECAYQIEEMAYEVQD